MERTNKIVLSGYYGFDNIGDEAVLYSILELLKKEINNVEITVLSNNPEKTSTTYGVKSVNRWDMKSVAKVIKESDLLISGGGSLLQDVTSSKTIPYYLAIVKIAQFYKRKVVFYSQGIGPVSKGFNKWLIKYVVNKVDGIFVREPGSKRLLEDIGIRKPIEVAIDPVIGIEGNGVELEEVKNEKSVGVYIRPWQNEAHDTKLIRSLTKGLSYMAINGYKLYLIPMHYDQDKDIAYKLKQSLLESGVSGEMIVVVDKKLSIDEVLAYTKSFDMVIGMRLHSLIMSAASKVPMLALSYDPKVDSFMKEIELPYIINTENISSEIFLEQAKAVMNNQNEQRIHLKKMYEVKKEKIYLPINFIKKILN